jgi:hypothetical protein
MPMLSPYFERLKQDNIDFATKVAVVNKQDDNLTSTKLLLLMSASLGVMGCIGASVTINLLRENKNKIYQLKNSEFSLNEIYANASRTELSTEMESKFAKLEPEKLLHPSSIILQDLQLETAIAEQITLTKEEEKKAAKLDKEIKKISGKKADIQDETSAISEDEELLLERKESMLEALKNYEKGWLHLFIDGQKPFWLTGAMGSGKTWTLASIGLIRKYCFGMEVGYIIDEHANGSNSELWDLLKPRCKLGVSAEDIEGDYQKIALAFEDIRNSYFDRIKNHEEAKKNPVQDIIDEYTEYKDNEIVSDAACKWYKSHLKDSRKAYRWTIAATHNDTNGSYPDNSYNQRVAQTVLVEKKSQNSKTPLSKCKLVRGFFDDNGEHLENLSVSFPKWFTPQDIYDHLTGGEEIEF